MSAGRSPDFDRQRLQYCMWVSYPKVLACLTDYQREERGCSLPIIGRPKVCSAHLR